LAAASIALLLPKDILLGGELPEPPAWRAGGGDDDIEQVAFATRPIGAGGLHRTDAALTEKIRPASERAKQLESNSFVSLIAGPSAP
jgi:hypothetical protein